MNQLELNEIVQSKELLSQDVIGQIASLGGGTEMLVGLFDSFLVDTKELIQNSESAWKDHDLETLKREIHTLKGLCGTIGANQLFEICYLINNELKNDSDAHLDLFMSKLLEVTPSLINHIENTYF